MSTKHVRTGGDVLRFGCSVHVRCGYCGSTRTFSARDWVMVAGGGVILLRTGYRIWSTA